VPDEQFNPRGQGNRSFYDVLVVLIERLPFAELSIATLGLLLVGGFIYRLCEIIELLDRQDGEVPFYTLVAFFFLLISLSLVLILLRTRLVERQLRDMARRPARQPTAAGSGLPSAGEYSASIRRAEILAEGSEVGPHD